MSDPFDPKLVLPITDLIATADRMCDRNGCHDIADYQIEKAKVLAILHLAFILADIDRILQIADDRQDIKDFRKLYSP